MTTQTEALKRYLDDCDKHAIVPDIAGAFHFAWQEALAQPEPNGLAAYVIGCFGAAEAEGLQEALAETTDERLKDLVERRLMYALYEAQKPQPKEPEQKPVLVECGNCHQGLADMEHVCKKCLGAGWVNNPQLKEPDQDEVDIRSRLYQRIHELETQLAQPEQDWIERERSVGYREGHQNALKQMAQPEQKPVAYIHRNEFNEYRLEPTDNFKITDLPVGVEMMLYTTPPQRKPLTDEQREEIAKGWRGRNWTVGDIIDATEAAHNIKE